MDESVSPQVQRQTLACLLVAQGIVIAPLFVYLPLWLGLIWLLAVVIRVQVYRGIWRYPGNLVKGLLGLLSIGGLLLQYGVSMGVEPMVGLLLSAFVLKLVEARQRRDFLLIIFIGFIAIAAQFLFSQTILSSLYGLISCVALIVAWHSCFITRHYSVRRHLKHAGALVLQTVPLMVLLFVLLPRVGPLWSVPTIQSAGTTGFSDSMAPGDIAQLSLSSEVAFRVTFEGPEPEKSQMYWRGLVLDRFDGRRWHASDMDYGADLSRNAALPGGASASQLLTYSVMLEAHQQSWLFFLLTPVDLEIGLRTLYTANDLLKTQRPLDSRILYRVSSDLGASRDSSNLSDWMLRRNLQLPESPENPRTRELVASWQNLSPRQTINAALALFQQQFTYTLQPPPLGRNSIDEFLFITRKGFCEHFAGSFVYLMRAADIPARVVVGYQGGERNQVEDYWLVRQSSAHAWAEVWLAGQGWQRVDPTAVVAPDRVELGLSEALAADEVGLAGGGSSTGRTWSWLGNLRYRWDALSYAWHRSVLAYDNSAQQGLLKRLLGGVDPWRIGLAVLIGGALLLGLYGLIFWYNNRPPAVAPEIRLLRKAEDYLGVPRASSESPRQWAERVAAAQPQRARAARQIARLFEAAVYADRREYMYKLQETVRALAKR